MKIKEQFENHPVPWGLGLIIIRFAAGFGARGYILPLSATSVACSLEGLPALEEAHSKRIDRFNRQLVSLESAAADFLTASLDQEHFQKAADRIRKGHRAVKSWLCLRNR